MSTFYEFFAGGGMARAGLGRDWTCLFANDIDPVKGASYEANWGGHELKIKDVSELSACDLPAQPADLAWASFPCQDLSLAGAGAGLKGARSGTFWPFWGLIQSLAHAPSLVVLENVCGLLSSHEGKDFPAILEPLVRSGYRVGALVLDAIHFVPQSRPRLFIVGVRQDLVRPEELEMRSPGAHWHPANLIAAVQKLPAATQRAWTWWRLPAPPMRARVLDDLIEERPTGVEWHSHEETQRLLSMMTPLHRSKVDEASRARRRKVGAVYKRMREGVQRAEVRFDDVAGCLRTPAGGSSRQTILVVEGKRVRSRLLSPREAASLMGLPATYQLPERYNDAYHLVGDGLVVPVVRFLAAHLLEPLLQAQEPGQQAA